MLKKAALGLAVFAASLLLFGLVGEIAVRALWGRDTVMFPRYHTKARYGEYTLRTIRPRSTFRHTSRDGSWEFVTNGAGFRDTRDFPYQKPPGTVRVLVLGDSHTQGYEARQDHTFSAILERYLRQRGVQAEVINTGVSGFSTAEELLLLENEGYRYQPDYVVLALFANDYEDNVKAGLFGLDARGQLQVLKKEHVPGVRLQDAIYAVPGVRWLGENSYLYSMVFNNVWAFFKARLARDRTLEYAVASGSAVPDAEVKLMSALLERMYRFCHQRGAKLVVLDVPAVGEGRTFASSIVPTFLPVVERSSDAYLDSGATLADLAGAVEIHVAHGHRHVSEFTHLAFGIALGKRISDDLGKGGARVSSAPQ
jgi:GDSL-like lipase/acylhydrolase family protein